MRLNPFKRREAVAPVVAPPEAPPRPDGKSRMTSDGFPIVEFSSSITNLLRMYGNAGGTYGAMFARQPNVRTCIGLIAKEAAELSLKMYEKVPTSPSKPDSRLEISDHRMAVLLEQPTPGKSTFRFWYDTFADIETYDFAVWRKIRTSPGKPPEALLRIPPASIQPHRDPFTQSVDYWRTTVSGAVVKPEDLVVFWGYDPEANESFISAMETLRRQLAEEWAAGLNREGMWKNSLRKDGVIEQELEAKKMNDEARESFLLDVADALSGASNSGQPLLLEPGQHFRDINWSPREMEYISARRLSRVETASAFFIPPAMVAASIIGQEADKSTLEVFYSSTLPPRLSRVEREIEAQLLPEFDLVAAVRRRHYVEFNLDAKLRGSFEDKAAIMATTAGGPVVTVNEARARLNLPPVPGGDKLLVPLNSLRGGGGQASPQNPVDTPAPDVNPAGTTPGGGSAPPKKMADEQTIQDMLREAEESGRRAEHAKFVAETRERFEDRHLKMFERFFERQRNALAGGKSLDTERWTRELADDLSGLALQMADAFGEDVAGRFDGDWDLTKVGTPLRDNADGWASRINGQTVARLTLDGPDIVLSTERAKELARDQTAFMVKWSLSEARHQTGREG